MNLLPLCRWLEGCSVPQQLGRKSQPAYALSHASRLTSKFAGNDCDGSGNFMVSSFILIHRLPVS